MLRWLAARVPDWDLIISVAPEAHSAGEIFWHGVADGTAAGTQPDAPHPLERLVNEAAVRATSSVASTRRSTPPSGVWPPNCPQRRRWSCARCTACSANDRDVASRLLPEFLSRLFTGKGLLESPDPDRVAAARLSARRARRQSIRRRLPRPEFGRGTAAPICRASCARPAARPGRGLAPTASSQEGGHEPETARHFDDIGENRTPIDGHVTVRYRALWPQMKAFALPTYTHGRVRINLRGRERDGIVAPEEFDAVCQEVEEAVRACRNPRTGGPVVEDVIRVCASDPHGPNDPAADLLVMWKGCADAFEHPGVGLIGPLPYDRTGAHSTRGFVLMAGPGIPHADLGERPALDLTPTIVTLLGYEPLADLRGQPLL